IMQFPVDIFSDSAHHILLSSLNIKQRLPVQCFHRHVDAVAGVSWYKRGCTVDYDAAPRYKVVEDDD
ncbi:hypothetical protein, partial [uncultured Muribaculum sp.]|uniref:hypothetical protein n=1 Tax=uncultured Muribaculum sp. TaxID=1918613 RepID=UPI0025B6A90E